VVEGGGEREREAIECRAGEPDIVDCGAPFSQPVDPKPSSSLLLSSLELSDTQVYEP